MAKSPSSRSREQRTLRRKVDHRNPKRTFLVFCEGKKTEPAYLKALKREPEVRDIASVDIHVHDDSLGSAPKTLVEAAADARARTGLEASEIDEVWCIFDVEWPQNHPNLKEALELAKRSKVNVAVSNPCFELWLLLHFHDQSASLDTKPAKALLKKHAGTGGQALDGSTYMPLRAEAAQRALLLEKRHKGDGAKFPNDNPSSGMYPLPGSCRAPHRGLELVETPPGSHAEMEQAKKPCCNLDYAPVAWATLRSGPHTPDAVPISPVRKRRHQMPNNKNRHVVPNLDGGWDVKAPNSQRSSAHTRTQAEAEGRAKVIVSNLGGGEVVIHRPDGRIRDRDTVAPGNDPHPPKDRSH